MTSVFVSGCFDAIHAGHVQFLRDAAALGDRLIVSVADDDTVRQHKNRHPFLPASHRAAVIGAMGRVNQVVVSSPGQLGLDFEPTFRRLRPDILAVTADDLYAEVKRGLCAELGARYVVLPKSPVLEPLSSTDVRRRVSTPMFLPLRVDFAGGWLDLPAVSPIPATAIGRSYVVNCAIEPRVSAARWLYERASGLGGSAAAACLAGNDPFLAEKQAGVGWQDPAVILETGLCIWQGGDRPSLILKCHGQWLRGHLALEWTGRPHDTPALVHHERPWPMIVEAGQLAAEAVREKSVGGLCDAVHLSYHAQLEEGMPQLLNSDDGQRDGFGGAGLTTAAPGWGARKYSGSGWGGYAMYLFRRREDRSAWLLTGTPSHPKLPIEPWLNPVDWVPGAGEPDRGDHH